VVIRKSRVKSRSRTGNMNRLGVSGTVLGTIALFPESAFFGVAARARNEVQTDPIRDFCAVKGLFWRSARTVRLVRVLSYAIRDSVEPIVFVAIYLDIVRLDSVITRRPPCETTKKAV